VQQSSEVGWRVIDADSTIRYQSESIERILGMAADNTVIGTNLIGMVDVSTGVLIRRAIDEGPSPGPYATHRHRGHVPPPRDRARPRLTEMTMTNPAGRPERARHRAEHAGT